jgi:hypothetical protein
MAHGETNTTTTICNISKGHGHPRSPSNPPLGRGTRVSERHDTRIRNTSKLGASEPVARNFWAMAFKWAGEREQGIDGTPLNGVRGNTLTAPQCHGMTTAFTDWCQLARFGVTFEPRGVFLWDLLEFETDKQC